MKSHRITEISKGGGNGSWQKRWSVGGFFTIIMKEIIYEKETKV